jgi:predicted dehydrogenase
MKSSPLRVGVIGLGMGRNHVSSFQSHRACRVVAVADSDPARLQELGDQYKVPGRYTDPQVMLDAEGLDVVSIAVPNKFHRPLALAAFKAGCHVLCEKPMALNAREGREMLAAAKKAGKRLMINFSFRFTPASWGLKREVDRGALGEVYFGRTFWHRRRGMPGFGGWFGQKALAGGGPLIDLGVHRLDLALWLMGYPEPAWVMAGAYDRIAGPLAKKSGKAFDVEDLAGGMIRFTNGACLTVEASWAANIADNEWMETRLLGDKGGLVQRNVGGGYEFEAEFYADRGGALVRKAIAPAKGRVPTSGWHFIDCIVKGVPHLATGEEGLRVMEILDAMYRSAQTGNPVRMRGA